MISGRLNKKIIIQQFTENSPPVDSYGEPSGSWETYATRYAEKIDQKGREFFAGGMVAEGTSIFRLRYISGLTEAMRISYDSKYWDIESIIEIGRKEGHELIAKVQS